MSERGEDFTDRDGSWRVAPSPGGPAPEASYPSAPAPRPEPHSVDEVASPVGDPEQPEQPEQQGPAEEPLSPLAWTATGGGFSTGYPGGPPDHGAGTAGSGYQADVPDHGAATTAAGYQPEPHPYGAATSGTGYPPSQAPVDYPPNSLSAAPAGDHYYGWTDVRSQGEPAPYPAAAPTPSRSHRDRERRRVGLGVVVLLVLVALLGGIVLGALGARELFPATSSSLPASSSPAAPERAPESVAGIAAAALESTVYIQVFGESSASSGSGMVLREDGFIVTNNHVIAPIAAGGGRVSVTFADGSVADAEIVGSTSDYDIAVLHVDREGLTPLVLAAGGDVVVGDPAVAVGAPLGLEGTVTTGIISALNRPVQAGGTSGTSSFLNAIQTDAAINPGNSGGPLLNLAGEVVGINTAIAQAAGQETGSIGLGFAIPADQVRRTAEQIITNGHATYPVIGVALDTRYQGEGVQVLESSDAGTEPVTPGGPGDVAGIGPGDIITRFDDVPVTSPPELIVAVRSQAPGATVVLTVRSGGQEHEVEVVLGEEVSDSR